LIQLDVYIFSLKLLFYRSHQIADFIAKNICAVTKLSKSLLHYSGVRSQPEARTKTQSCSNDSLGLINTRDWLGARSVSNFLLEANGGHQKKVS